MLPRHPQQQHLPPAMMQHGHDQPSSCDRKMHHQLQGWMLRTGSHTANGGQHRACPKLG